MSFDLLTRPAQTLVFLGMLLPSLSVSVAAFLAQKDHQGIQKASTTVQHCRQVDNLIHALVADVVDVEAGQRGFLLTGRHSYLAPLDKARTKVSVDLVDLKQQLQGQPAQLKRLDRIQELVTEKLDLAAQTVVLETNGQHSAAVKLVRADESKNTTESIRELASEMSQEQELLLVLPQKDLASRTSYHARALWALLVLNTLSIGCILLLLRSLTQLKTLVRMCAWSRTIEYEGKWLSFEEYLGRRFNVDITHGISPNEAAKLADSLPLEKE